MTQNANNSISIFLRFFTKTLICVFFRVFALCVITFVLIRVYTPQAPQNDLLNLSFVKDKHIVGEKMARNGCKTATCKVSFISKQSILIITLMTFQMSLHE